MTLREALSAAFLATIKKARSNPGQSLLVEELCENSWSVRIDSNGSWVYVSSEPGQTNYLPVLVAAGEPDEAAADWCAGMAMLDISGHVGALLGLGLRLGCPETDVLQYVCDQILTAGVHGS